MFVVAIGTDYNILMTTRLREEVQEGKDPRTAAEPRGRARRPDRRLRRRHPRRHLRLARTHRDQPARADWELTIAIGVAIVSFVMAAILVPSLSALLGKRVRWPGQRDALPATAADGPQPSGEPAVKAER